MVLLTQNDMVIFIKVKGKGYHLQWSSTYFRHECGSVFECSPPVHHISRTHRHKPLHFPTYSPTLFWTEQRVKNKLVAFGTVMDGDYRESLKKSPWTQTCHKNRYLAVLGHQEFHSRICHRNIITTLILYV